LFDLLGVDNTMK